MFWKNKEESPKIPIAGCVYSRKRNGESFVHVTNVYCRMVVYDTFYSSKKGTCGDMIDMESFQDEYNTKELCSFDEISGHLKEDTCADADPPGEE